MHRLRPARLPRLRRRVERQLARDAGVVDERVDRAERVDDRLEEMLRPVERGEVGLDGA
jgi:hypothetical protein